MIEAVARIEPNGFSIPRFCLGPLAGVGQLASRVERLYRSRGACRRTRRTRGARGLNTWRLASARRRDGAICLESKAQTIDDDVPRRRLVRTLGMDKEGRARAPAIRICHLQRVSVD